MAEKIVNVNALHQYKEDYKLYCIYVCRERVMADVRDGLKPVVRKILVSGSDLSLFYPKFSKSARLVGDAMGKYHPHGDCLAGDTLVYCLDGNVYKMEDVYNNKIPFMHVLSIDQSTGRVVPAVAHSFRIGQYAKKIYHFTLSNGTKISCTGNHPIMDNNGNWIKAEDIDLRDNVFIPYRKALLYPFSKEKRPFINGDLLQNIVYNHYYGHIPSGYVKHHRDENPHNNQPGNFECKTKADHARDHGDYYEGLEKGRVNMFSENGKYREATRQKNSALSKLFNSEQGIRRFKHAIGLLKERGLKVTEDNYESLRGEVYNLPKIDKLISKGYGKTFDELVSLELPSIGELYNTQKIDMIENINQINDEELKQGLIKSNYDNIMISHIYTAMDNTLKKYGFLDYELFINETRSNIDEMYFDKLLYKYLNDFPVIIQVQVEELEEAIPMYDFTVDGYENMLIATPGSSSPTGNLPLVCVHNSSIYGTMKPMSNEFEIKVPLLTKSGSWGNKYGDEPAAMRYTETTISKFTEDVLLGDYVRYPSCVDWMDNFDNTTKEPECLPAALPILLVNGSFGIGVGLKIEIPKHNLSEVIDETVKVIKDKSKPVKLIPDQCMNCEIIDTDFEDIGNKGYGYYTVRGVIEEGVSPTGNPTLIIKSAPDLVYYQTIDEAIKKMITAKKLVNIISTNHQENIFIIEAKKGTDLNYIKQMLYQHTDLQKNCRVSFEVLDKDGPIRMSYKAYILFWLEYRKFTKLRIYYAQLQDINTEMRRYEPYIKLARSPKMNELIQKIRKATGDDEWLMEYLIKELDITDLQAKFIINLRLKNLTKAHLDKYVAKYDELAIQQEAILNRLTNDNLVEQDIIEELLEIKAKYGTKRTCKVISKSEAVGIPQGTFRIIITEGNCVKKLTLNEGFGSFKNDKPKYIIEGDNTENLIIFNEMGKVFKLPIHKISFSDKRSNGIDIRLLLKNCTSNINAIMYEPMLKSFMNKTSKYFIVTLTNNGYIKKMDIDDFLSANTSGLIYAKIDDGDFIKDIMVINHKSDVIVYTANKALRFSMEEVPYLKRSTKGNKTLNSDEPIMGVSVVLNDTTDIIVVTRKGYVNRIPVIGLQKSSRTKAPNKVIKLGKGDYIVGLYGLNVNDSISITTSESANINLKVEDIPSGSSVSTGVKMIKTRGEEIISCHYQKG